MKKILGIGACGVALVWAMLATLDAHDPITTRVTWNGEIARIVEARCVTCHSPDGRGPMSLATYEDARPWAKAMKEEVMTRRMPKWHAVRGYGDFANDPSLSAFEIALIVAWADGGAPREDRNASVRKGIAPTPRDLSSHERPAGLKATSLACGDRPLPEGTLVALQPQLEKDDSVGIALSFPDGRREIVGWIRDFDPDFPTTYWLRTPIAIPPGTMLSSEPREHCSITVSLTAPR
jgi:hypothetical protein